ncbi:unnamed protein product [Pleuronectes platessa]|uniref:Uncharacterized protein n=1 Tax=Pleuronectes platessa TaxID=8262 RepID=A0A9N7ZAN1_PLEPL|nr:unnamed protein product [Pleuronectes platessa]
MLMKPGACSAQHADVRQRGVNPFTLTTDADSITSINTTLRKAAGGLDPAGWGAVAAESNRWKLLVQGRIRRRDFITSRPAVEGDDRIRPLHAVGSVWLELASPPHHWCLICVLLQDPPLPSLHLSIRHQHPSASISTPSISHRPYLLSFLFQNMLIRHQVMRHKRKIPPPPDRPMTSRL